MKRMTVVMLVVLGAAGCGSSDEETRTIRLRHMDSQSAVTMVEPYLHDARIAMSRTDAPATLTITATPEKIAQIEDLFRRYDVPAPGVLLHFQIIEADGFATTDSAIADVEASLRDLFRFSGYRLVGEAMVRASAREHVSQALTGPDQRRMQLQVSVGDVPSDGERRAVQIQVGLEMDGVGPVVRTGVTVPDGQTVVLGASRPIPDIGALILVVRPRIE